MQILGNGVMIMKPKESERDHLAGAIRDAFIDYGGVPNVVDGLLAVAKAIDHLAEAIKAAGVGGEE
jgi:hypothetical protein